MVKIAKTIRTKSTTVAAVLAVLTLLVLVYASVTVKNALQIAQARKSDLAKLHKDLAHLDAALADTKAYDRNIQFIRKSVPGTYHDVARAISVLEAIAATHSVKIELTVDEKAVVEPSGLSSLRIEMQSTGTYFNQTLFFADIASLPFFAHVDTLKFDGEGQLSSQATLRIFIAQL